MSADMSRAEHMRWCKQRALAELEHGTPANALASLASDFRKHPETENDSTLRMLLGVQMLQLPTSSDQDVRRFIEGFAE